MLLVNHALARGTPAIFVVSRGSSSKALVLLVRMQIRHFRHFRHFRPLFLAGQKHAVYQKRRFRDAFSLRLQTEILISRNSGVGWVFLTGFQCFRGSGSFRRSFASFLQGCRQKSLSAETLGLVGWGSESDPEKECRRNLQGIPLPGSGVALLSAPHSSARSDLKNKQRRKREPKPKLCGPDIFHWGRGLPRERVGAKKVRYVPRNQGNQTFWAGYPGILPGYPGGARKV